MVCPWCRGEAALRWEARDENRRISPQAFRYWHCGSCGFTFLGEVPADLGRYYKNYHEFPSEARLERNARRERYKVDLIERFVRGGRLLEIGSSYGAFASAAKTAGFLVEVIEHDEACRQYLRDLVGVTVLDESLFPSCAWPAESYDVVAMWQVIEHLSDPLACLGRASAALRLGGVCVIATPNPNSLQARLLGRRWPHLDAPRHISLIPVSCLLEATKALGLELEEVIYGDEGARAWNRFGWQRLLMNRLPTRLGKLAGFALGYPLSWAAAPWEGGTPLASTYTAVFRRSA